MAKTTIMTGASGFVGKALSRRLIAQGDVVVGLVRRPGSALDGVRELPLSGDSFDGLDNDWPPTLACDVVVHLAARVHVMGETSPEALPAYRTMNVDGTLRVARAALRAGARRFVFVSSVKAVGERSVGAPVSERDTPAPQDAYGLSKLEAERALFAFGRETGMEIVVVRPPLVYGPGVRANFLNLMRAIDKGFPLPVGAIAARRSLVYVENLTDAIAHCTGAPAAAGQVFHVADERDVAVKELAAMLAEYLDAPRRLLPVPATLLRLAGRVTGRTAVIERLVGELRLDCSHIRETIGWRPPYTIEHGLRETAAWYRSTH
ncbi:MAG TPA: NAD-dependent epimerase/dehydratase family protein [Trinickia sp.]|uniref:NAD-dependent epimerase/dehydratase family protein n=1 Tax=Trinickia sp. TaxID=2571163 RepID=UPI002B6483C3|nr:NAD-dependent epimerase/dehydratase family protein [Trinickia sp.]HVW52336.1 NAD-dependent epimerase/dehydratase family protein [Trinickia sp.]